MIDPNAQDPLKELHAEVAQLSLAHLAGDHSSDTATGSYLRAMRGRIMYGQT